MGELVVLHHVKGKTSIYLNTYFNSAPDSIIELNKHHHNMTQVITVVNL